jgi:APA family basic amino acid/polyamine antiporter
MVGATAIMLVLLAYRAQTTWPGLVIVLTGVPIYFLWKKANRIRSEIAGPHAS